MTHNIVEVCRAWSKQRSYILRVNFLAHLLLDHHSPEAMIGSILPDLTPSFARRSDNPAIQHAIDRHRRIDRFTDLHPLFVRSKARLFAQHGRYSGILVDVFYDHVLSAAWMIYHAQPLSQFIASVYDTLGRNRRLMPPSMRPAITRMIEQDWLGAYANDEGLRRILAMMSWRFTQRFGRCVSLEPAVDDLVLHRRGLIADFTGFFPMLVDEMAEAAPQLPAVTKLGAVPCNSC